MCLLVLGKGSNALALSPSPKGEEPCIYKISEIQISKEAETFLEQAGIVLYPEDLLEFKESCVRNDRNEEYHILALQILHANEEERSCTTLSAYVEEDNEVISPADIPLYITNSTLNEYRNWNPKSYVTITGKTYFTCSYYDWDSYYKPSRVDGYYSVSSGYSPTLQNMMVSFQTEGDLYTSSYSFISSDYVHSINKYVPSPVAGITYGYAYSIPYERQIRYTGNINSGMWLYFYCTLNGQYYEHTVSAMITPN